jgi:IS5 family transposase
MLIATRAQKPIPLGGTTGDDCHIWDEDLAVIDDILLDDELIDILWRSANAPARGRGRMALNHLLRSGVLKHIKNWSFRSLYRELQRNLDYRSFTQFFDQRLPSFASFSRNFAHVDAQTLRELNERVCVLARRCGMISGRRYRQDTTVCEANVHYPTDSDLLEDGVRVLHRLAQRAIALVPSLEPVRDRSRAVRRRVLDIARTTRSRGEAAKQRRESTYRSLLRVARPVVTGVARIAERLGDRRVTRHVDDSDAARVQELKAELDVMLPRVERVLKQTRARICRGVTDYPEKILSLFEPATCAIRKGKPHKPTEFGRVVDLVEVENGFVSDYQVLEGNPNDRRLLIPALKRHVRRFGRPPHLVAADRGFWSATNERTAHEMGVKRVSIPFTGRLTALRKRLQRTRWFRSAQRWRANGEGRIGTLKNVYGMDRCHYKGDDAMERWVAWCVLANNLVVMARFLRQQKCNDRTQPKTGQEARAAA